MKSPSQVVEIPPDLRRQVQTFVEGWNESHPQASIGWFRGLEMLAARGLEKGATPRSALHRALPPLPNAPAGPAGLPERFQIAFRELHAEYDFKLSEECRAAWDLWEALLAMFRIGDGRTALPVLLPRLARALKVRESWLVSGLGPMRRNGSNP